MKNVRILYHEPCEKVYCQKSDHSAIKELKQMIRCNLSLSEDREVLISVISNEEKTETIIMVMNDQKSRLCIYRILKSPSLICEEEIQALRPGLSLTPNQLRVCSNA